MVQSREDIGIRFSVSLQVVENAAFPIKNWHLKLSFLSFAKFVIFAKISKNHVLSFLITSALSMVHSDLFIFDNVIYISSTLRVPSIRMFLSIGRLNG